MCPGPLRAPPLAPLSQHLASHHPGLAFRCLACTAAPRLFLLYSELADHFPAAHRTSLQPDAVLLPDSLTAWVCTLCPAPALLSEAAVRAHIRGHSQFFDREERWRVKCRQLCRICDEVVQGEMKEHLGARHPRDTFGDINDIVGEVEDVAEGTENSKIVDYPAQDSSQSTLQSPLRPPEESSGLAPPSPLSSPPPPA
jgi:hypothetical protein